MKRYELSREYHHGIGMPEIIECADGRFVRWEDAQRLREALAGLIACDDLKRRIAIESATMIPETDEDLAELDRLMSDLANRLPKAWETARAALSQEQER